MIRHSVSVALAASLMLTSGALSVTSDPSGAAVYVDGQFVGETPIDVPNLEPGDHRVRLVKDGYLENGRIVTISAGRGASLQVRLTARTAADALPAGQTGGGISSGGSGGGPGKKWLWIGLAGGGAAATTWVLANRPSIDAITAAPSNGLQAGTNIAFTASGVKGGSLSWDFGDGAKSNELAPRHVYNSSGTFTVRCSVGDSNQSASTTVTVRSLAGNWRGVFAGITEMLAITQSGATIGGTFTDTFGNGAISGFVATSSPLVRATFMQPGFFPFTFTADPNADINTLSGFVNGSGYNNVPFTVTRQ